MHCHKLNKPQINKITPRQIGYQTLNSCQLRSSKPKQDKW